MTFVLMVAMIVFVGWSAVRAVKESPKVKTVADFFSFGPELTLPALRRAFQATNISFTTSFVLLYYLVFSEGYYTIVRAICFWLGMVIYSWYFLPRQIQVLSEGHRYPELLAKATNSEKLRALVALFVILSLWMFTFAEVQGLNLFLGQLFSDLPSLSQIVPVILISALAFYVSRNGYRATTSNDKLQVWLIFIGAIAVIVLSVTSACHVGWGKIADSIAKAPNPYSATEDMLMFVLDTFLGLVFSQLLYYDNWQRLSFYTVQSLQDKSPEQKQPGWIWRALSKLDNHIYARFPKLSSLCKYVLGGFIKPGELNPAMAKLVREIRLNYVGGGTAMLLVFAAPIILGVASLAAGTTNGDIGTLAGFFKTSWDQTIFGLPVGPPLVILSFVFMLSALLSTAETYILAFVNCLVEDISKYNVKERNRGEDADSSSSHLESVRILTAITAVSLVPFLLFRPSFDTLFNFLFYSGNGLVGPLVFLAFQRRLTALAVWGSTLFGFVYLAPVLFPSHPHLAEFTPYPGIIPVLVSLAWVGFTSKPKEGK